MANIDYKFPQCVCYEMDQKMKCLNKWDTQSRRLYDANGIFATISGREKDGQNQQGVVVLVRCLNSSGDGIAATLDAHYYKGQGEREGIEREFIAMDKENEDKWFCCGNGQTDSLGLYQVSNTLDCMHDQKFILGESKTKDRKYIVRRLTPTECARLQGFPDWWTDGADGSDTAIYKMWGNGIALPCAADVIGRLAKELE